MTFNCYKVEFGRNFAGFRRFGMPTSVKQMQKYPYCQRENCSPLIVLFPQCIDYVDIAGRSSARGRQTRVGWRKRAVFELNASIFRKSSRFIQSYDQQSYISNIRITQTSERMRFGRWWTFFEHINVN